MNLANLMDTPMKRERFQQLRKDAVREYFSYLRKADATPEQLFNRWAKEELEVLKLDPTPDNWLVAGERVLGMIREINRAEEVGQ